MKHRSYLIINTAVGNNVQNFWLDVWKRDLYLPQTTSNYLLLDQTRAPSTPVTAASHKRPSNKRKSLSEQFHREPAGQLHCSASARLLWRDEHHFPKEVHSFRVWMMVVESAVTVQAPLAVPLWWDLVTVQTTAHSVTHIFFIIIKPLSDSTCSVRRHQQHLLRPWWKYDVPSLKLALNLLIFTCFKKAASLRESGRHVLFFSLSEKSSQLWLRGVFCSCCHC